MNGSLLHLFLRTRPRYIQEKAPKHIHLLLIQYQNNLINSNNTTMLTLLSFVTLFQ